jgi:dihydropteroate synthase
MRNRAANWQLRSVHLAFDRLPRLMAIVNVTPDSFSDGGKYLDKNAAVDRALQLVQDGADIIDIGGESTRPYSESISEKEELARVLPAITAICESVPVPISIDTSKATVAREAIAAGAQIINDVTGLDGDPGMVEVALESQAGVCAMHMQGSVQTMQNDPRYDDVVEDILSYLKSRKEVLMDAGIAEERICLDPGIGFGKTHAHNLELIKNADRFHETTAPILIGHSRKGFIGKILGDQEVERDTASMAIAVHLAGQGIQVIRMHEVAATKRALMTLDALGWFDEID